MQEDGKGYENLLQPTGISWGFPWAGFPGFTVHTASWRITLGEITLWHKVSPHSSSLLDFIVLQTTCNSQTHSTAYFQYASTRFLCCLTLFLPYFRLKMWEYLLTLFHPINNTLVLPRFLTFFSNPMHLTTLYNYPLIRPSSTHSFCRIPIAFLKSWTWSCLPGDRTASQAWKVCCHFMGFVDGSEHTASAVPFRDNDTSQSEETVAHKLGTYRLDQILKGKLVFCHYIQTLWSPTQLENVNVCFPHFYMAFGEH